MCSALALTDLSLYLTPSLFVSFPEPLLLVRLLLGLLCSFCLLLCLLLFGTLLLLAFLLTQGKDRNQCVYTALLFLGHILLQSAAQRVNELM